MTFEITMPKLSDTMEEGTLVSWKKSVGEKVERGDIIAEVETDKANMELESFVSGVLLEIRVKAGQLVPVGTVIVLIGEVGKDAVVQPVPEPEIKSSPGEKLPEVAQEAPLPKVLIQADISEKQERTLPAEDKASPLARRMARELGIDLHEVKGTGPDGRILREDLEKLQREGKPAEDEVGAETLRPEPAAPAAAGKLQPFSRMRAAIARTVTASWRNIPHFSVSMSIDMGAAEALYRSFKQAGVPLTINDMIVKSTAMALQKFPNLNASYTEDGVILYPEINIGIAVSVEGGLLVPVVKGCERLSLKEIAAECSVLIGRAREGKIRETDLSGGTFSVSNLGMFGVDAFSAVIYPSHAAILAVAAIRDTPVAREGRIVPARMMTVTLSSDHRLVDGADAARFLAELRKVLESPAMMLV